MKLLLVSEGKNELRSGDEPGGALQIIIERLLGFTCEVEKRKASDPTIIREIGKGDGMFKRAVAWMRYAQKNHFEALVLVIDEDGFRERLRQISEAQGSLMFAIPRALGLAIKTFDAWMLADELALSKVLGVAVNRQRDMESLRYPKEDCRKLSADKLSLTEFYAQVASEANLADLEARCPIGFGPFASRVRALKG